MVIKIPALGDNFIYLYLYDAQNSAFAVDPGDGQAVMQALKKHNLRLTHILTTHSHFDHTAGIKQITGETGCEVVQETNAQTIRIGELSVKLLSTPGHTRDSRCIYIPPSGNKGGVLFTGDTLFVGGCGRIMGCDAQVMWESLAKIRELPEDTLVYPGHNYTEENYEFALTIEPDNKIVRDYLQKFRQQRKLGKFGIPSNIGREKGTNIFLRADTPEVKSAVGKPDFPPAQVFTELRKRKDRFG